MDDLSQLAFGFGNGAVTIVRGDLIHDRGAKQRTVFESEEPITGIAFREGSTTALCIATTARILTLVISGRGHGQPARTIDESGCAVGCLCVEKTTQDIVVARDDAIYHYGLHGKGSRHNCDGHKTLLKTYKDYVVVVCPSSSTSMSRTTATNLSVKQRQDLSQASTIMLLNTDFHIIAHSETFPSQVKNCFAIWDQLFILMQDGKVNLVI